MNVLAFFVATVFAAETALSPLTQDRILYPTASAAPSVSFGDLMNPPQILGDTTMYAEPIPEYSGKSVKEDVTLVLLGDSMVDTLGPEFPELTSELTSRYPGTSFTVLNYGVGGTNIDYGIERITTGYEYLGNRYDSLVTGRPDIVVVESFAYNPYPFDTGALERHWLALAHAVDLITAYLPDSKIIIAATIGPNNAVFGDGAANTSFSPIDKQERVGVIKKYLESATRFAQSQNLPLADAYHPSLGSDGNGKIAYINAGDHIHYSPAGRTFFAEVLAETITENRLLE